MSHTDADYRLIAATNLAELGRETKAIDLALLQSFLNDARVRPVVFILKIFYHLTYSKILGSSSNRML